MLEEQSDEESIEVSNKKYSNELQLLSEKYDLLPSVDILDPTPGKYISFALSAANPYTPEWFSFKTANSIEIIPDLDERGFI